ncbi:MAG: hypothetical protein ACOCVR_00265 [Myxococcota bacterium]
MLCLALLAAMVVGAAPNAALAGEAAASTRAELTWKAAESRVIAAREALDAAEVRRERVRGERESLEAELDLLAGEIVELKSRPSRGVRAEAELNRRLQSSQQLSARIDELAREDEDLTAGLVSAAERLLDAYEAESQALRADLERLAEDESAQNTARAALERLVAIGAEKLQVTQLISSLRREDWSPGVYAGLRGGGSSDDPEELRARADILRDTKDRLVRRLGELERKAETARRQRALEREMEGFLAESRLFDEGDRASARLVTSEDDDAPAAGGSLLPGGDEELASGDPQDTYDDGAPTNEGGWDAPSEPAPGDSDRSSPELGDGSIEAPSGEAPLAARLDRVATRAESSAALDALLSHDGGGSPEEIEAYQEEIERLIRRLDRRADRLERRAAALEATR